MSDANEVAAAIKDSDERLIRATGLLAIELKPGMDRNDEALEEVRDLVIETQRDLRGIKSYLERGGYLPSARTGAEGTEA